jgi:hypothetical protein
LLPALCRIHTTTTHSTPTGLPPQPVCFAPPPLTQIPCLLLKGSRHNIRKRLYPFGSNPLLLLAVLSPTLEPHRHPGTTSPSALNLLLLLSLSFLAVAGCRLPPPQPPPNNLCLPPHADDHKDCATHPTAGSLTWQYPPHHRCPDDCAMCLLLLLMCRSFVCTRPSLRHNRLCLHNHHPPICAFPYPLHRRRVLIGLQGNKINILAVSPPPPHHHRFESVCSLCRCCATVPLLFVRLHPPLPPQPPPPINLCLPTTHRPLARIAHYNGTNHTLAVSLFAPLLLCCHCQALLPLSSEFIGLCFLPVLFEECKRERELPALVIIALFPNNNNPQDVRRCKRTNRRHPGSTSCSCACLQ